MFKHTTKESILYGFLSGMVIFIGDYFWTGGSFNGLMMALAVIVFLGFLRPPRACLPALYYRRTTRNQREESKS